MGDSNSQTGYQNPSWVGLHKHQIVARAADEAHALVLGQVEASTEDPYPGQTVDKKADDYPETAERQDSSPIEENDFEGVYLS
ncbi:hypothetical protein V5O48_014960 [Marasmius crinis-equi]|uniref:Uncharacterized protein n=1 Tax=Marasmius crinis-equi TaxID=585013 RepID=A0ABR3EW56_9AGAR